MIPIRLCASGCQYWNRNITARGDNMIAYCSTLAIYIINIETYAIHKIIASHQNTITAITWNPINPS